MQRRTEAPAPPSHLAQFNFRAHDDDDVMRDILFTPDLWKPTDIYKMEEGEARQITDLLNNKTFAKYPRLTPFDLESLSSELLRDLPVVLPGFKSSTTRLFLVFANTVWARGHVKKNIIFHNKKRGLFCVVSVL